MRALAIFPGCLVFPSGWTNAISVLRSAGQQLYNLFAVSGNMLLPTVLKGNGRELLAELFISTAHRAANLIHLVQVYGYNAGTGKRTLGGSG
jgi:hypothetical protein